MQPGGVFVTPFGFDWKEGEGIDSGWQLAFEKIRPEDGATVRRWSHSWCEPAKQWWHTEDRFEVELNGVIIAQEEHRQSPEVRWYSQADATQLFQEVGFTSIQLFRDFELNPASADDRNFTIFGVKPETPSAYTFLPTVHTYNLLWGCAVPHPLLRRNRDVLRRSARQNILDVALAGIFGAVDHPCRNVDEIPSGNVLPALVVGAENRRAPCPEIT